jgi:hypothetical protein
MEFRRKLLRTLAAFQPVLKEPGILVASILRGLEGQEPEK